MNRTYFITGGGGNLARQLAAPLIRDGARVVLFDIAEQRAETREPGCEYVRGDMTDARQVEAAIAAHRPQVVLHLASMLSGNSERDRALGWNINTTATLQLMEAAVTHRVETFFFPSSLATFGGTLPDPLPEDHPQWPDGIYGVAKVACERMGHYYHRRHGLDFRCLRLPVVVSRHAPAGAASAYASRAFVESVAVKKFTFKVEPQTRVSTVYVRDALLAMRRLVDAPAAQLTRRVYNLHAIAPSAEEIAAAIRARVPGVEIGFAPERAVADLIASWPRVIDDQSSRRDWGWRPRYDLDAMADDLISELTRDPA